MASFEWLASIYFAACAATGVRSPHRARGFAYVAAAIALVIVARLALPWEARAWMPHAYLVLGYWIPAVFTPAPHDTRFEDWLLRTDRRLLVNWNIGTREFAPIGSWAFGIWELSYLLCYPLVPAAFLIVFFGGTPRDITRFWLAVLLAGYSCYGTLPWTAARPPRIIAADYATRRGLSALNARFLGLVSHNLNTFPSGHVAVAVAAGLAVWPVSVAWGAVVLVIAALIVVAAVAGRYHYGVDVLAGLGAGAAAAAIAAALFAVPGTGGRAG